MRQGFYWTTPVKHWEIADGGLSMQDEFKYAAEAKAEMMKVISEQEDLRVDEKSFNCRLVTRFKSGKVVDMVFPELGPRDRFAPARTDGMLWREAQSARLRSIDSNMAFLANQAANGFKALPEQDYPEEVIYQATMYAERVILPPKISIKARDFSIDEIKELQ